MFGNNGKVFRF